MVDRYSAVMLVPTETAIGLDADHRQAARFKSDKDINYRPVVKRLTIFRDNISRDAASSFSEISVEVATTHSDTHAISETGSHTTTNDVGAIFEIPFPPSHTFYGRELLLSQMYQHLQGSDHSRKQWTFAICGLGKSITLDLAIANLCIRWQRENSSCIAVCSPSSVKI